MAAFGPYTDRLSLHAELLLNTATLSRHYQMILKLEYCTDRSSSRFCKGIALIFYNRSGWKLTVEGIGLLAAMVVIRTMLGWTTALEITGRWPWQRG